MEVNLNVRVLPVVLVSSAAALAASTITTRVDDAIDGVKVDREGNVYVSGPGGLWIFSAAGKCLGIVGGPEHPHNMAWGGADGKTLYLTAQTGLYRLRLNIGGSAPSRRPATDTETSRSHRNPTGRAVLNDIKPRS